MPRPANPGGEIVRTTARQAFRDPGACGRGRQCNLTDIVEFHGEGPLFDDALRDGAA